MRGGKLVSVLKVADHITCLLATGSRLAVLLSSYSLWVPPSNGLEVSCIDCIPTDRTPLPLSIRRSGKGIARIDAGSCGSARNGCRASRSGSVCRGEILQDAGVAVYVAALCHTRGSGRAKADGTCCALVSL